MVHDQYRKHAPQTRAELIRAISDLARRDFSDTTIAAALGLSVEYVRECLAPKQYDPKELGKHWSLEAFRDDRD